MLFRSLATISGFSFAFYVVVLKKGIHLLCYYLWSTSQPIPDARNLNTLDYGFATMRLLHNNGSFPLVGLFVSHDLFLESFALLFQTQSHFEDPSKCEPIPLVRPKSSFVPTLLVAVNSELILFGSG